MNHSAEASIPENEIRQSITANCLGCGAQSGATELFCSGCGRVLPAKSDITYFDVFTLPRKLTLDVAALEREFYRLSRLLHPDAYARASQQEQESSLANSSLLNDAYRTLKDPIKRTEYLLKLEGVLSSDEGGVKNEDRVPPDLLEEVFELNMQLDEMRMNRQVGEDDTSLHKDLLAAKVNFDDQLKTVDIRLQALWEKWDATIDNGGDESQKTSLKGELSVLLDRRRYIRNLVNSVDAVLEDSD
jgi:molecular chaperone HscB